MTKIGDHYFDFEAVDNVWDKLFEVEGVDKYSLSYEAVKEINDLLGVSSKETEKEIRAIRNAVVKRIAPLSRNMEDINEWKKWNMWMSAITAAIDQELYNRGFMV